MKYIITQSQYNVLLEQPESRFGPEQFMSASERQDFQSGDSKRAGKALMSGSKKQMDFVHSVDPHTMMMILELSSLLIPVVGPFISAGIALSDAAMYYREGDKKTAGLTALFAAIPAIGGLSLKLGLSKLSSKYLVEIGKKISFGSKLTPNEIQVVNRIAKNKSLIQSEIIKFGKSKGIDVVSKTGKQSPLKQRVKNIGKDLAKYSAVGAGYSKSYDYIQKDTPKTKSQNENLDWNFVKTSFGSSGSEGDNNLLNIAWDKGWRPGQAVPKELQTQKYQKMVSKEMENLKALNQLIGQTKL